MSVIPPIVSKDSGKGIGEEPVQMTIPLDPYAQVPRLLSEEEMSSPAVQKLLLSENDRKDREIDRLKQIESQYYKRDKDAAVLEERLKKATRADVLYTVCEIGGSALAGISSVFWNQKGWLFLLIGLGFIIGGILFKVIR